MVFGVARDPEEEQYLLVANTFIIYESIERLRATFSGVGGYVSLVYPSPETR